MENNQQTYFIGQVVSVNSNYKEPNEDETLSKRNCQEIIASIPGFVENVIARPVSGLNDEPKVGDTVLLYCLDPIFHSSYVYQKLKENDFIGIRAAGKAIDITDEKIVISVYDENDYVWDEKNNVHPTNRDNDGNFKKGDDKTRLKASLILKNDGEIEIFAEKGIKISTGTPIPDKLVDIPETELDENGVPKVTEIKDYIGGNNNGPFCAISRCPFTNFVHTSSYIRDTNNDKNEDLIKNKKEA